MSKKSKEPNGLKCLRCGKALVGRQTKNCSNSCKAARSQEANNRKLPEHVKRIRQKENKRISDIKAIEKNPILAADKITFREPKSELQQLQTLLQYWRQVKLDAENNIYSLGTIAGTTIGAVSGKTAGQKIARSATGLILGRLLDGLRQQNDIRQANLAISNINERIKLIRSAKRINRQYEILKIEDDKVKIDKDILSSLDYRKAIIPSIELQNPYRYLMGDISLNTYIVLTGAPGNGKSTFAVQFANYFDKNHGKAILMASEQSGANKPLQMLLERENAKFDIHPNPRSLDNNDWIETCKKYKLVVIDSANHLNLEALQIEELREKLPKTVFLVVLQSTKEGSYKGSTEFKHNCDVFLEAKNMEIHQTKSRFSKPAHIVLS